MKLGSGASFLSLTATNVRGIIIAKIKFVLLKKRSLIEGTLIY